MDHDTFALILLVITLADKLILFAKDPHHFLVYDLSHRSSSLFFRINFESWKK